MQHPITELIDEHYSRRREHSSKSGSYQVFEIKQPHYHLISCAYRLTKETTLTEVFDWPALFVCLGEPLTIDAGTHGFISLQSGRACLLQSPGESCEIVFQKHKRYQFVIVHLTVALIRNAATNSIFVEQWKTAVQERSVVLKPAQELPDELTSLLLSLLSTPTGEEGKGEIYYGLSQFVRGLLNIYYTEEKQTDLPARQAALTAHTYLLQHACDLAPIEDILSSAGFTGQSSKNDFKQITGETPLQFVVTLRIQKAKELLVTTELSINEIAKAVGYTLYSSFAEAFPKAMGCTALQYRKHAQQNKNSV